MVLTKINTVEMTNDGNSILRELDVGHPSARCLIELSQTQDEECGDGTTTVIILAAELLDKMVALLDKMHPIRLCRELTRVKNECIENLNGLGRKEEADVLQVVRSAVSTKLCTVIRLNIPEMAVEAAKKIKDENGPILCDIKHNLSILKINGDFKESQVLDGIIIEKDIIHAQMRRRIEEAKVLMLGCGLEYKKGETATSVKIRDGDDFTKMLQKEETQVRAMVDKIKATGADLVLCEKGISDLALSIMQENNITALRRFKKSDMNRLAKATGSTVLSNLDEFDSESGSKLLGFCGLFEYKKIGETFYSFFTKCKEPKAVSVVIAAPTRDLANELERNFYDGVKVARNMIESDTVLTGGGATEMALAVLLGEGEKTRVRSGVAEALKSIPSILATNSGAENTLELLSVLYNKQKETRNFNLGINGITGEICEMDKIVSEAFKVKSQTIKSAFDAVMQLLRVDGIIECSRE
ncbi:TCPG [Enterospora canceri]|uniref:TCPG n=1 Tax=Enterospora canceri TaxID=1081671 RepID=A0A1Y1S7R1_9MICR|nr:TCPG [Enterospora canceri]